MPGLVVHEEWRRRQAQRSVLLLLGLLAVVAAAGQPVVAPVAAGAVATAMAPQLREPADQAAQDTRPHEPSLRYWAQVADTAAGSVRLRLQIHRSARPVVTGQAHYLRCFCRPPTR